MHSQREGLAALQSAYNRHTELCESAGDKIYSWKQRSEKASWRKRLTLMSSESHRKVRVCAFVHMCEREERVRQMDTGDQEEERA